jgi:hypothetical protein
LNPETLILRKAKKEKMAVEETQALLLSSSSKESEKDSLEKP